MKKLFSRLGVAGQIFSGFGAVIAISAIAGTIAVVSMFGFEKSFDKFDDMASDALLASEINADMAKTLLFSRKYMVTRTDSDLALAKKFLEEVKEGVRIARDEIKKPYRAERVAKISEDIVEYEAGLERVIELYAERDRLVNTQLDVIGPQVRKGLTKIATTAAQDGDLQTAFDAALVQESLMLGRLFVAKFLLSNSEADLARMAEELNKAEAATERLQKGVENPTRQAILKEIIPQFDIYKDAAVALGKVIQERNEIREQAISVNGEEIGVMAAEIKASSFEDEQALGRETHADVRAGETMAIGANAVAIVIALLLAWLIGRNLSGPISAMTAAMGRLAEGDNEVDIPARERRDELGKMAEAVQVFKENAIERVNLQSESEREQEARAKRQKTVDQLIENFRGTTKTALSAVSANMDQMKSTATALGEIAETSAARASETVQGAEETSSNVQTVAAAAEELAKSITEISSKVAETTTVVGQATDAARESNEKVANLTTAAQKIGDVVSLIQDIAEQTNLLALNATIEAARAGEAGRGFAVVASEVKELASQTAKATQDISLQVTAIQTASTESAEAITEIARTMEDVNQYTTTIATAVEEQGAATAEISRNVQQAADGTRTVVDTMSAMNQAVADTSRSAEEAGKSSSSAVEQTEDLRRTIDGFLKEVAAA